MMRNIVNERELVFVSYSRKDAEWRDRFLVMLAPVLGHELEVWSDQREVIGEEWRPQLEEAIRRSRIALVLISSDSIASPFIMEQELPALLDQGAIPFYVLVRPCLWQKIPILEKVQWAYDPKQALSQASDREGAIVEICMSLMATLPRSSEALPAVGEEDAVAAVPDAPREPTAMSAASEGRLVDVPLPPLGHVTRVEFAAARLKLLGNGSENFDTATGLGLHGPGGVGKTVLAAALARDEQVRRHFPDGVFWVALGDEVDIVAAQRDLLARLGEDQDVLTATQGKAALGRALADQQALLIVDDVWTGAAAVAFRVTGPHLRVLYTSRDLNVLRAVGASVVKVDVLSDAVARQLLANLTQTPVGELPALTSQALDATGRVALAVSLIGAAVGRGAVSWQRLVEQLKLGTRTFLAHPYANTFKAMQIAVAALSAPEAAHYQSLAVYPQDTKVPIAAIARYWSHLWGDAAPQARQLLEALAERELLTLEADTIAFHDLQRDFLLLRADDIALQHAELLVAYRALLPPNTRSWAALPLQEPYIWAHLLYHLEGASDGQGMIALVCDLAYVACRAFQDGPRAVESEVRRARSMFPDHVGIAWVLRLVTQWSHLLTRSPTLGDLAATLSSRAEHAPPAISLEALGHLLPAHRLRVRWGLRDAPSALVRAFESHDFWIYGLAFSPDGGQLATVSHDAKVRLWNPTTGNLTDTLVGHAQGVTAVAFSPDGTLLATASYDQTVRLWDSRTGHLARTLTGHAGGVHAVVFAPDGAWLATGSADGTVRLWEVDGGESVRTLETFGKTVNAVAFSPDGAWLAATGSRGMAHVVDLTGHTPARALEGHHSAVVGVAFSPDHTTIATACLDGDLRLWDHPSGQLRRTLNGHSNGVRSVAFAPDGTRLASGGGDGTVRLWDPVDGQETRCLRGPHSNVDALQFSPDGAWLASSGSGGITRLWDATGDYPVQVVDDLPSDVEDVAVSPDGTQVASVGGDERVRLWDAASGQPTQILEGHSGRVCAAAYSHDGTLLATAGADQTARLWDPSSGQSIRCFEVGTSWLLSLAFSPDGRSLATAGMDWTVRLYNLNETDAALTLEGHQSTVTCVIFSPDGAQLVSSGLDRRIRLWDRDTGKLVRVLDAGFGVQAVAFSPNGAQLAAADGDGKVQLWEPGTGQLIHTLDRGRGSTASVAFSPDGAELASAGSDGTVRLWDPVRHVQVAQLAVGASIAALAWSDAGIAVGTSAGEVVMLEVVNRSHLVG